MIDLVALIFLTRAALLALSALVKQWW